jgi:D-alanyl-D-alanine carboxypeptidase
MASQPTRQVRRACAALVAASVIALSSCGGSPDVVGSPIGHPPTAAADLPPTASPTRRPPSADSPAASAGPAELEIRRALDELVAEHSGALALVSSGAGTWAAATGEAARGRLAAPGDRFDLASGTKTYVATVVLQLAGEGRLSLDGSVETYLPGRVRDGDRILVRHLLNHTSGIGPSFGGLPPLPRQDPLLSKPGTTHRYSNANYLILGWILENVTRAKLDIVVRNRLLGPMHLGQTRYGTVGPIPSNDPAARRPGSSMASEAPPPWLGADSAADGEVSGSGGIISTAHDVAMFYRALLAGRLLRPDQQRQMLSTVPSDADPLAAQAGAPLTVGLGMFRFELPCGVAWGHGGDTPFYSNQVLASPDGSRVVVVAQNRAGWTSAAAVAAQLFCL